MGPPLLLLLLWAPLARASNSPLERLGTHIFLEAFGAPFAALNSSATVSAALRSAVAAAGLTVVGEHVHQFPVMGVSSVLLISESHLSIHTWPERGYAAVDLFTCGSDDAPPPCRPSEPVRLLSAREGWRCADGGAADAPESKLWRGTQALLAGLLAGGAQLTWHERGLPPEAPGYDRTAAVATARPPAASSLGRFGWLGGLEGDHQQRPEL